ncbi:RidA family protein [Ruania alba]|uniref:Reactive intermediate/imine deaminase n=1 Tax=Ruania alba TaxID=648782 RepID=A0A1H5NEA3_9MICO|nr:reactive intermediate/imine deaminase [Ruania alba]
MTKTAVHTDAAPPPAHAFPQGVRKGPFLQVSGQGPVDPATREYVFPDDVAAQTTRVLENVAAIVRAGGASFSDVISLRVFLTDRSLFPAMNEAYAAFVEQHGGQDVFPARTTVICGLPREEMLVEIDALAVVSE